MFASNKTVCPMSREQFLAQAKSVEVTVNGQPTLAQVKEFSTGSFGWHHGDKLTLKVGDTLVKVQVARRGHALGFVLALRQAVFAGRPRPHGATLLAHEP